MTTQKIASLALKIVGIYSIIQFIEQIRALVHAIGFSFAEPPIRPTMIIGASISSALLLGLSILLLAFSNRLARKLFPEDDPIENLHFDDLKNLQSIAFSIVGVVIFAVAIPKIFQISATIYALQKSGYEIPVAERISKETFAFGVATIIQLIIGLLLFLGGPSLSNLWQKFVNRIEYERNITNH
jgi:hypothetical protein